MIEKEGKEIVKPQYLKEGDKVALISGHLQNPVLKN